MVVCQFEYGYLITLVLKHQQNLSHHKKSFLTEQHPPCWAELASSIVAGRFSSLIRASCSAIQVFFPYSGVSGHHNFKRTWCEHTVVLHQCALLRKERVFHRSWRNSSNDVFHVLTPCFLQYLLANACSNKGS